ncbi:hypothetical protein HO133_002572 [Letharia lupina]|uniref:NAD(P)-binding protein n=1 Tax=Letharia lupina TaxID=560253 RepID=A0A8H6CCC8_9LECA|nr:uncharacterized protein HO133_002572 [Letharia lupina]KAF6220892.1 hypothetical protein HO133_002572 [Letharia lupina]
MSPRIILITRANRGIGFSILQALATRSPSHHYLLAARSTPNGELAIQELRKSGVQAEIDVVELDVANEASIKAAERKIRKRCSGQQRWDRDPRKARRSNIQESYAQTFSTNITGVALMMTTFLPLMKESSPDAQIINISSARASLHLSSTRNLPPSTVISYSVSKTALNALTVEYAKAEPTIAFYAAIPGHCKTAFNGFRGTKDPLDGARVVVELVLAEEGKYENGS